MSHSNLERLTKVVLVAGYLGLLAAVVVAHRNPATGYELSLYLSTPPEVWAGLALAAGVGCLVGLLAGGRARDAAALLVGAAAITVFAMPVLRGYHFYGAGDSMSHLGWAREMAAGSLDPTGVLYPAVHVLTVAINAVAGVSLPLANLYLVLVVFPLVFVVFTALCVQLLAGTRQALVVGALVAVLFSPINNVSVHPTAHPASQTILFLPVVLYLVLRYVTAGSSGRETYGADLLPDGGTRGRRVTPFGVVLALASATVVLLHPQQALNVVALFVAVAVTGALYRRFGTDHPIGDHRPLYAQTAIIAGVFLLWAPRFPVVRAAFVTTLQGFLGGEATAGDVVAAKSQSLAAVGGDIALVFVRLFLPGLVLSILAAVVIVGVLRSDVRGDDADAEGTLVYLTAALLPLFGVFLLLVVGGHGDMYFRYQGFIMVPVTVLGGVTLAKVAGGALTGATSARGTAVVLPVVLVLLLVFPVAGIGLHPSSYMYQPGSHVTESGVDGYAESFEHRVPDREFVGIRGGPRRYVDAVYGTERADSSLEFPGYRDRLPESVFNEGTYSSYFTDDRYMGVTTANRRTEVRLFGGFRYSEEGFRRLDSTPGVSRVRSNEGFQLYYLDEER